MKPFALAFGLLAMWLVHGQAVAAAPAVYTRKLDCGSFTVTAQSTIIWLSNTAVREQSTRQWIRLVNPGRHLAVTLNLKQRHSADKALGGRLGLEAVAYEWSCAHTASAGDFLLVDSECVQNDSVSCSAEMSNFLGDWAQIFDAIGNPLFRNPPDFTEEEEARLHRLGLWHSFQYAADPRYTHSLYPPGDHP